jgi:hypothetical protein
MLFPSCHKLQISRVLHNNMENKHDLILFLSSWEVIRGLAVTARPSGKEVPTLNFINFLKHEKMLNAMMCHGYYTTFRTYIFVGSSRRPFHLESSRSGSEAWNKYRHAKSKVHLECVGYDTLFFVAQS